MAKYPGPVKSPKSKSAVSKKVAAAKASAATAKAERGPVEPKMRYLKMSTLKGSEEARDKGKAVEAAKSRRSAPGGFGATKNNAPTPSDRAGSMANVRRAAETNRGKQRSAAASVAKSAAGRKAAAASKGASVGSRMDKRSSSFEGAESRAAANKIARAKASAYPRRTLPKTK